MENMENQDKIAALTLTLADVETELLRRKVAELDTEEDDTEEDDDTDIVQMAI